jgi:hypothetical protein
MRVHTRYASLAPAIKRAGFEPFLLNPIVPPEPGSITMSRAVWEGCDEVVIIDFPYHPHSLIFERDLEHDGWKVIQ